MQVKSQLKPFKSTSYILKFLTNALLSVSISILLFSCTSVRADFAVDPSQVSEAPQTTNLVPIPPKEPEAAKKIDELTPEQKREQDITNFNNQQDAITNSQSRLGDELKSLPGPNIDFQGLLRLIITWSASLAASVAIFLVVMRSFASISGTEETHNELKTTIIKVVIGLVLIFFSYLIVSFLMGIIWAGGSVGG